MQIITLAGGTGLIGKRLLDMLTEKGYLVRLLTRRPNGHNQFFWNPEQGEMDEAALEGATVVINLAGAGIADKRWSEARKHRLIESRVAGARILHQAFERMAHPPQLYLAAAAIGFYGNTGERLCQETDPPADNSFMVVCCKAWEDAAKPIEALGIRTVRLRIGIVLAKTGGALKEVIKPIQFGLGAYFSDGQAWWSWVHLDDVCRSILWAIETPSVSGVYNVVAPQPVRNEALVRLTAKAMRQPALFLPAPGFMLQLILGEMSSVVLNSNRVSAEKIQQEGFVFQYPELEGALNNLV